MDPKLAAQKFREADEHFKAQHFAKALELLTELDVAFPKDQRILYPKALCLSKVGRPEEALSICNILAGEMNHTKAAALQKDLLNQLDAVPPLNFDVSALDDILGPAPKRNVPPPLPQGRDWKPWWIGAGIAVVAMVLALPLFLADSSDDRSEAREPKQTAAANSDRSAAAPPARSIENIIRTPGNTFDEAPKWSLPVFLLIGFCVAWLSYFLNLFLVLAIMGKLPGSTFGENTVDIATNSFFLLIVGILVSFSLGCLGALFGGGTAFALLSLPLAWAAQLTFVSKTYELSCGELFLFLVVFIGLQVVIIGGIVFLFVLFAAAITETAVLVPLSLRT